MKRVALSDQTNIFLIVNNVRNTIFQVIRVIRESVEQLETQAHREQQDPVDLMGFRDKKEIMVTPDLKGHKETSEPLDLKVCPDK